MPSQNIHGATLHYTQIGNGSNIVLLHGFPLSARMWDAQLPALSAQWRVTAPDFRGFGQSPPAGPFTMESLADDVHALLESLKVLPCVLVGLSMGGYVSIAYAKKYPNDLRGLVLVDTQARADSPEAKENRNKLIDAVKKSGSKAAADAMLPKLVGEKSASSKPDLVKRLREMIEATPKETIEHALVALRDRPDQTDFLPKISVPTLIIVGDSDVITPPAIAEGMQQAIPKSQLAVIRGAGHMSPMEQSEQVNAALRRFLSSGPSPL